MKRLKFLLSPSHLSYVVLVVLGVRIYQYERKTSSIVVYYLHEKRLSERVELIFEVLPLLSSELWKRPGELSAEFTYFELINYLTNVRFRRLSSGQKKVTELWVTR